MRARPGRLLPSVIVGGLLISGLALGAGTASAADPSGSDATATAPVQLLEEGATCTIPVVGDAVAVPGVVKGAECVDAATKLIVLGQVANSTEEKAAQKAKADKAAADKAKADKAAADKKAADQKAAADAKAAADKAAADKAAADRLAAQQGRAVVPPPALGAPAPLAAAGPVGALPALPPLAGVAPAGLASSLFGANAYDPGLLMGSPLGNAASALFSPQADSAVTTVSQAQALAATGTSGYGTPVTIGVIILACLIGFAVRHRVISRMKSRELPAAEYQPRHAAPEPTPELEPETDLHSAADDAKTLVVLTRR